MSQSNETRHIKWYEAYKCKCRLDRSVCNNKKVGKKINADLNVKNWLIKAVVIKDLFGILVTVIVNVINYVMLENIYSIKIVNAEKV